MPQNPLTIRSVVSSSLVDRIAKDAKIEVVTVLTGFKYIGEQILLLEQKGEQNRFIFGYEESCGYLAGTYVRDKDAVVTSMLLAEATSYFRARNMSPVDVLENIYKKYGYYINTVINMEFSGIDGANEMKDIMSSLRENVPLEIAQLKVLQYSDFEARKRTDTETGELFDIPLPKTDMISYQLENSAEVMIRPSGTEPKMKVYITTAQAEHEDSKELTEKIKTAVQEMIKT